MTEAFALAPYDASRRDDYLRLLTDAWGSRALTGEELDWWFDGDPEGSVRSVALRDGEVVGVAGHHFVRVRLHGAERLGQLSVHAVTAPSARGLGIFRALERRHEDEGRARGSTLVLAFASASTRALFLGPLGFTRIDRRRVWARIAPIGRRGRRLERFEARHERAYLVCARRWGNHIVRSLPYLEWRYLRSPRGYRAVETESGGFAVVGTTRRRGLRVGLLLDLVATGEEAASLLRAALAEARGCAALLAVPTPSLPRRVLLRHGFVPTAYRLDLVGRGLGQELDTRPRAWTVSLGDTDFF